MKNGKRTLPDIPLCGNLNLVKASDVIKNDHAARKDRWKSKNNKLSQTDRLLRLAKKSTLFHNADGKAFAKFDRNGCKEIWPIASPQFSDYLKHNYYRRYSSGTSKSCLDQAIGTLKAQASYEGKEKNVYKRIAYHKSTIYIDLCNEKWEVVEITSSGWRVLENSPVCFVRNKGMRPLPKPEKNGSISELKRFINTENDRDYRLIIAWLIAALRPDYPIPILTIQGEQGSGKSTLAKILVSLIDPSKVPSSHVPTKIDDLMVDVFNSWVISYDNLSGVSNELSDSLCQIATGSGFKTRKKYHDTEQVIVQTTRPIILNGIDDIAKRADLLDRSIVINLPSLAKSENGYIDEQTLWADFEQVKPKILGSLYDLVSTALANVDHIDPIRTVRMADFARWVVAAEQELGWKEGQFIDDYETNKNEALGISLRDDPLAQGIIMMLNDRKIWDNGGAAALREDLKEYLKDSEYASLPIPSWIGRRLNRLKPSLRKKGIDVQQGDPTSEHNTWIIKSIN